MRRDPRSVEERPTDAHRVPEGRERAGAFRPRADRDAKPYHPDGPSGDPIRRQKIPIIGDGGGAWSWIQIEDAAVATADVLTSPLGVYHVVADDPSPVAGPGRGGPRLLRHEAARRLESEGEDARRR